MAFTAFERMNLCLQLYTIVDLCFAANSDINSTKIEAAFTSKCCVILYSDIETFIYCKT